MQIIKMNDLDQDNNILKEYEFIKGTKQIHVLILEDNPADVDLIERELKNEKFNFIIRDVDNYGDFKKEVANFKPEIILSDYNLPSFNGLEALQYVLKNEIKIPFIFVSGIIGEEKAIETVKKGATDYVSKEHLSKLPYAVLRALCEVEEKKEAANARSEKEKSESKLKAVLSSMVDFVLAFDGEGKFIFEHCPKKFELFGSVDDAAGLRYDEVFPVKLMELFKKAFRKNRNGEIAEFEFFNKKSKNWFSFKLSPINYENTVNGSVAVIRDITQRKNAEKKDEDNFFRLHKAMVGIVHSISMAIEMRDCYTAGHQKRVADLSCKIAEAMKLDQEKIENVYICAIIHDLGKIAIPNEILSAPRKLTEIEFLLMKNHTVIGNKILKDIELPWPVATVILQHHERIDGSGYPNNLKGDEIILESKIIGVADVVEAMSSHRPYRPALGIEEALEEIKSNRGVLYDPEVVDACLSLYKYT